MMPAQARRTSPTIRKKLRRFLNLTSEEQVTQAFAEAGAVFTLDPPSNPGRLTRAQRDEFRRSWHLTTQDEVDEALTLAGLITVMQSDLAEAAKKAKYPLTVAKAIVAAARGSEEQLRRVVPILRERGHSWTQIGDALGITKQSAWERYSGEQ